MRRAVFTDEKGNFILRWKVLKEDDDYYIEEYLIWLGGVANG